MSSTLTSVVLPELHSPSSGRLDAQLLAGYLNVPLARLAAVTGKPYSTLYKTPDSPAVQKGLFPIKRSLDILARVIAGRPMILAWLNSPHPDLGERTPLQVILEGRADAVEGMLEDAMAGMPG